MKTGARSPQNLLRISSENTRKKERRNASGQVNTSYKKPQGPILSRKSEEKPKLQWNFLRTDPAIIPLENTMPQADPRTELIIFMDRCIRIGNRRILQQEPETSHQSLSLKKHTKQQKKELSEKKL